MTRTSAARFLLTMKPGGAFTPASITGLSLWLDASDATTLFQDSAGTTPATADADVVGYWADKSGNGKHATQGTTANKPLLKLTIKNGLNVVRFDGADDLLSTALALPNAVSAVIVYANKASGNRVLFSTNAASNSPLQRPSGATIRVWPHQSPAWIEVPTTYIASAIFWLRWNYTTDVYSAGLNTTSAADTVARGNPGGNIQFGAAGATPIEIFSGDLCEILVFSAILTDGERDLLLSYLNAKWAVY